MAPKRRSLRSNLLQAAAAVCCDIQNLNYTAKKAAVATVSPPPPATAATMVEGEPQEQGIIEEIENPRPSSPPPVLPPPLPVYDINRLPHDPGERLPFKAIPIKMQLEEHIFSVNFVLFDELFKAISFSLRLCMLL
ncbi:hypothetical protein PVAP13_9KG542000 [Panicum virgatum]|uniref:Uncharacterized protein n=1 Tax=Panicum virgatum TaxID=38727 RepID=A0A8T0NY70_PANVG|nr:hypothetical protein PVAP13_9KG542000 [Panicum virgatum]